MKSETYNIREHAHDEMRSPRLNGSLRAGCDLADSIRAHADPIRFLASLWDVGIVRGNLDAIRTLEKATKIISMGLRNSKSLSATILPGVV